MICVMLVGLTACQAAEDKNKLESSVVNNISTTEADNENESKADLNFANQNERVVNTFPSSYSKTINNCKFEIGSINSPNEVVFYNGTASASTIDCKGIVEYYFNGREYVILEQTNEVFVLNSNGDVEFGASLNGIGYVSCFSYYQNSVRYLPEDQNNNLSAYTTKRDFSFGTAEECYGKISDIYSKYGMNIKDNVKVITYYLDHETLAREEMVLDHNGIDNKTKHKPGGWMEDDDAYMFFITQECQGLPDLNWEGWFWEGVFNPLGDAGILIIYNKDGFVKVEPRRVIVDYTYKDETMRLLSFDDIVANVAEHLNGIISNSSTYTISEARLYVAYDKVTESEFRELELHWGFLVTQKDDAGVKVFEVYINAQTGEYESH